MARDPGALLGRRRVHHREHAGDHDRESGRGGDGDVLAQRDAQRARRARLRSPSPARPPRPHRGRARRIANVMPTVMPTPPTTIQASEPAEGREGSPSQTANGTHHGEVRSAAPRPSPASRRSRRVERLSQVDAMPHAAAAPSAATITSIRKWSRSTPARGRVTPSDDAVGHEHARGVRRQEPQQQGDRGVADDERDERRDQRGARARAVALGGVAQLEQPAEHDRGDREQERVARGGRAIEAEEEAARDRRAGARDAREPARRPARRRSGCRRASSATRCRGCASRRARPTAARGRARSARVPISCRLRAPVSIWSRNASPKMPIGIVPTRTYQPRRESSVLRISGLRRPRTQATRMRAMSARK